MNGKVINIYVYPKAGSNAVEKSSVEIIAGSGIVGDRYYKSQGTFSKTASVRPKQEITFIESEEIDKFNKQFNCQLSYDQLRRNVITSGVKLNDLVGKEFQVGGQVFKGIELCEPCAYLANLVESKLLPGLIGKGGLRTQIISSGNLEVGDLF